MKKYESYKPIKQDFLDEIPLKWGLSKLKFVANLFNGDSLNQEEKEMFYESTGNSFPYISSKDINLNTHNIDYDNGLSISEKYLGKYKTCKAETTLICIEGGSAGRKIAFTNQPCTFVNKLCAIEGKDNSKYIYFYTQSNQFQAKFKLSISGLIGGVSISELKNFTIPVPPLSEQSQIVAYLDRKTALIDALIEKTERKIALLKEKRTALINQAVTKGVDPTVPMKDSGVEWIGEIPEHWGVAYLRMHLSKIGSGLTPRGGSETYVERGVPLIRSQNVHFDGLRLDVVSRITKDVNEKMSGSKVFKGDVLLNITGGSIGRCCIVEIDEVMNVNQHVCILRTKDELSNLFLNYFLQSDVGQIQVQFNVSGGNREGLTITGIGDFKIPLPPKAEQIEISKYISKELKGLGDLKQVEVRKIDKLKEYRQALISEVVTGKLKVSQDD